jgi:hypothetical protein
MRDRLLTEGVISGRFYRHEAPLESETNFLHRVQEYTFPEHCEVQKLLRGYCNGDPPFGSNLEETQIEGSYADDGHGIWRMWIREDTRNVSRNQVLRKSAERCLIEYNRPLSQVPHKDRKEIEAQVKKDLLLLAIPSVRILPVVASRGWTWVGCRAVDNAIRAILFPVVGRVDFEPVAWSFDSETGWSSLSLAGVQSYAETGNPDLDGDVHLVSVGLESLEISCRMHGASQHLSEILQKMVDPSVAVRVLSLTFEVEMDGEKTVVSLDKDGVYRGLSPSSSGGLSHEVLIRRFQAVRQSAERVGEVLSEILHRRTCGDS